MVRVDPYTPSESYHECMDCHNRSGAGRSDSRCPECGGPMQNLSVARE